MGKLEIGDTAKVIIPGNKYAGRIGTVTKIDEKVGIIRLKFRDTTTRMYFTRFQEIVKIEKGE